jgi:carboxypeptidase C (cathepsin A)
MKVLLSLGILTGLGFAQTPPATPPVAGKPLVEEQPVVSKHEIHANGKTLSYTATAGMMPIKSATGEIEANLFHVSYVLDGTADYSKRPLMVAFNGGPGSASVWLHMGCIGPKRVKMKDAAGCALSTGGQRQYVARSDGPGLRRSGRHGL